jgi:transcriptional regulator with XRE-family HTH domain
MTIHLDAAGVTIHEGDCLDVMRTLPDASVDAVVTDPPYGLEFMGREWDGADGFRRSLNPADVGRKNVFGRSSRTSPEYRAGHLFEEWTETWASEAFRLLKPGGHLLAFGGTRTFHRLAAGIEDAGFEIRDSIAWLYGSGFPKSLDVSKAIDKRKDWTALPKLQNKIREARTALGISQSEAARRVGLIGPDETLGGGGFMWFETGMKLPTSSQYELLRDVLELDGECDAAFEAAEREVLSTSTTSRTDAGSWAGQVGSGMFRSGDRQVDVTAPATPEAQKWQGWGTALKPAFEPVVVARKPLVGTVAANVLQYGTGALNIDATRIGMREARDLNRAASIGYGGSEPQGIVTDGGLGRWPANVVLDEDQAAALDQQSGGMRAGKPTNGGSTGGAAGSRHVGAYGHGSGTTVEAAVLEGFGCIAIEREAAYLPLILQRVSKPHAVGLFDLDEWDEASA